MKGYNRLWILLEEHKDSSGLILCENINEFDFNRLKDMGFYPIPIIDGSVDNDVYVKYKSNQDKAPVFISDMDIYRVTFEADFVIELYKGSSILKKSRILRSDIWVNNFKECIDNSTLLTCSKILGRYRNYNRANSANYYNITHNGVEGVQSFYADNCIVKDFTEYHLAKIIESIAIEYPEAMTNIINNNNLRINDSSVDVTLDLSNNILKVMWFKDGGSLNIKLFSSTIDKLKTFLKV